MTTILTRKVYSGHSSTRQCFPPSRLTACRPPGSGCRGLCGGITIRIGIVVIGLSLRRSDIGARTERSSGSGRPSMRPRNIDTWSAEIDMRETGTRSKRSGSIRTGRSHPVSKRLRRLHKKRDNYLDNYRVAGKPKRVNKLVGRVPLRSSHLNPLKNYKLPDSEGHESLLPLQVESKLDTKLSKCLNYRGGFFLLEQEPTMAISKIIPVI